jgi:hypothetical protein
MATWTKTARTVIAAATSNAAGSTTRGTLALTTADGGLLTVKITNGGTGPTLQAVANVLVAHNASTPSAGSAGTDWKTLYQVGNGTVSGTIGEWAFDIPGGIMQLEVELTGNTGQAVTCESYLSEKTSFA